MPIIDSDNKPLDLRVVQPNCTRHQWVTATVCGVLLLAGCGDGDAVSTIRFATFNTSLNRTSSGQLVADLATGADSQAMRVAETIQRVRPDIVLLNEFDYDEAGDGVRLFQERYLGVPQGISGRADSADPIVFPYWYIATVNTGVPSGHDLDKNGTVGTSGVAYGGDAQGFGFFPGQFGMALLSRFPIDVESIRTFQHFLWRDMPGAWLPTDPENGGPWYGDEALAVLRLSSKSHWDIPIEIDGRTVHVLASHPTPPVFDGPEDRNGLRNHDEIRFWRDYITPGMAEYVYDDLGQGGGIDPEASFVIMGDQNADPFDGDGHADAMLQLFASPMLNTSSIPASEGGSQQAERQGGMNQQHRGNPDYDTSDFGDQPPSAGNLRLDYVLPSADLEIADTGVFWPVEEDPLFSLVSASDHRLVWVDVEVGEAR